jgi:hypothetical protein
MSAQIIQLPGAEARQPVRPQRKTQAAREAEREAMRVRELQERWSELENPISLDPTFRAWCMKLDQLSVEMDLPYMLHDDQRELFLRMFKTGAMRLQY